MKTFKLLVKAKQREESVTKVKNAENTLLVKTKERPIKGNANRAVIAAVARHLEIPLGSVVLKSGMRSKLKVAVVDID
ncbi:hypothetical protein COZ14_02835 [Candidatus Dojkabacteria bacterium CG_4_10_14_3_um_filter_Dojkabacteria_WS6_41_9]|uniref:DUF167 domain-containing protein n=1 Tax=Candidatus Dojkabacteria bacterium CG_4_10_14_0_2_um_filter_Dojkabacteria_WS6_41_15 TaxID=2014249 RepID=A0A2M7W2K4_9BACT|nr:MAG: hypothetical protein COZ14_02835 [Candidatus Dojkabacteria bacterium CG_4_10_14_3_um_filter_Dojkabacteria_WS6_41_9]PJA15011.1 MAG: hypothetical protein COX64_01315 [Candidatus Dojkabacteria bacterium CG_4_10_14_0_2_um_filter_Dojkabacteria_WS6_41_15]